MKNVRICVSAFMLIMAVWISPFSASAANGGGAGAQEDIWIESDVPGHRQEREFRINRNPNKNMQFDFKLFSSGGRVDGVDTNVYIDGVYRGGVKDAEALPGGRHIYGVGFGAPEPSDTGDHIYRIEIDPSIPDRDRSNNSITIHLIGTHMPELVAEDVALFLEGGNQPIHGAPVGEPLRVRVRVSIIGDLSDVPQLPIKLYINNVEIAGETFRPTNVCDTYEFTRQLNGEKIRFSRIGYQLARVRLDPAWTLRRRDTNRASIEAAYNATAGCDVQAVDIQFIAEGSNRSYRRVAKDERGKFSIEVRNCADTGVDGVRATAEVDADIIDERSFNMQPRGIMRYDVPYTFSKRPGEHAVRLRVSLLPEFAETDNTNNECVDTYTVFDAEAQRTPPPLKIDPSLLKKKEIFKK